MCVCVFRRIPIPRRNWVRDKDAVVQRQMGRVANSDQFEGGERKEVSATPPMGLGIWDPGRSAEAAVGYPC